MSNEKNSDALMLLMSQIDQHWEEMRHIEGQRSTLTNLTLVLSTAIVAYLSQKGVATAAIPLSLFLCFLGVFGIVATYKLYERHQFAQARLDAWYKKIDELAPNAEFLKVRDEADERYKAESGFSRGVSLHQIWIAFYCVLLIFGLFMYVISRQ